MFVLENDQKVGFGDYYITWMLGALIPYPVNTFWMSPAPDGGLIGKWLFWFDSDYLLLLSTCY